VYNILFIYLFLSAKNELKLKRALKGCSNPYTKSCPVYIDALVWHHSTS